MKVVVIGGTGLVGSKLVELLEQAGHQAVAASPRRGVNALTGEGLDEVLQGAHTVIDVTNSPSFEDQAVLQFFETSTRNLIAAGQRWGVQHHIALTIVGAERLPDSGYMRAKVAQEALIKNGGTSYTLVRATQFFEFLEMIAGAATEGQVVRLPGAYLQPIAAADVSRILSEVAVQPPFNGTMEIAGPDALPMSEIIEKVLTAKGDARQIVRDEQATYFGTALESRSLIPHDSFRAGELNWQQWLAQQQLPTHS